MPRPTVALASLDRPIAERFGARLKAARLRAGLTQARLAEGRYTKAYISALENGLSKPSMAAVHFLAGRLGTSPTELLGASDARWGRVEADLRLAAGDWQAAADAYDHLLEEEQAPIRRAELLRGRAEANSRLDRPADAVESAAESAAIFDANGLSADAALARYWQSAGLYRLENSEEARALLRQIIDAIRGGLKAEPDLELRALIALAMNDSREGRPDRALTYLNEARARLGELDDRRRAAFLESLAISYRESGDYEAAVTMATQAIAYFRAAEDELEVALLDNELALTHLALGTLERANAHALAAHERMTRLGDTVRLADVLETQAQIAVALGDLSAGEAHALAAIEAAGPTGNFKAAIDAAMTRARIARRQGDLPRATDILERALADARAHGRPAQARDCLIALSELAAETGDHAHAYELVREALA
ncbi:MAG TPA: tetratricopeptide repeat protein [Candidatus Limnocylindrales bacterium]